MNSNVEACMLNVSLMSQSVSSHLGGWTYRMGRLYSRGARADSLNYWCQCQIQQADLLPARYCESYPIDARRSYCA